MSPSSTLAALFLSLLVACNPEKSTNDTAPPQDTDADADTDTDTDTDVPLVFALDFPHASLREPAEIDTIVSAGMDDIPMGLLSVTEPGATTPTARLGLAEMGSSPPVQDPCAPTVDPAFDLAAWPFVSVGPTAWTWRGDGGDVTLHDLSLTGTIAASGEAFEAGEATFQLDMREVAAFDPDVEGAEDVCELLSAFGAPCEACATDGQALCLFLWFKDIQGTAVPGLAVDATSPSTDPACTADPGLTCATVPTPRALPVAALAGLLLGVRRRRGGRRLPPPPAK